ncbi:hypothetical protein [Flagellimonas iocasae]|uniref:Calcium/calmodulin-dependent protein kinase II association-domain domain-containing protein n=1 Tax=Flagellimonas iocasae TaxID=2055905 RepID=A0ABW4Y1L8_9FLAO
MSFKTNLSVFLVLLVASSCKKQLDSQAIDYTEIEEQVKVQVDAFQAADTTLNPNKVVDLLWPEFTMLVDGNYITYTEVKEGTQQFMGSLKTFHTEWTELKIIPIGEQHAISSFIFKDSIVSKAGEISQSKGPNTFVWEWRDGTWKVIYGDADHYPID